MSNKEELLNQFKSITNASDHTAQFYLESHDWSLDNATITYFEDQSSGPTGTSANIPHIEEEEDDEDDVPYSRPRQVAPSSSSGSKPKSSKPQSGGIRTLSSLANEEEGSDQEDNEDDKTQNYFTGGEKSGLVVQSGPKQKKGDKGVVDDVFDSAKKQGAKPAADRKPTKPDSFDSVGYMLGNTNAGQTVQSKPAPKKPEDQVVEVKITFWQQGFTLDEGPLRRFEDPQNREFLNDIQRGVIPRELEANAPPGGLSIVLLDNRQKDYVEPAKPRYVAFAGHGQALGSTPSSTTTTTTSTTAAPTTASAPAASSSIQIDRSQPTTTLQIRMADGSRQTATFNESHTLSHLINYINSVSNSTRQFDLLTGFPMKPLAINPSQTLKDAGLLGALVQQKYK